MLKDPPKKPSVFEKYKLPGLDIEPTADSTVVNPGILPDDFQAQSEESKRFEQEWNQKSGGEKFRTGVKAGWEQAKGGLKYAGAELWDLAAGSMGSIAHVEPSQGKQIAAPIKASAEENFANMPQGKGTAYEIGMFMPQMAGTILALGTAPLTGGTSAAAIPMMIGTANTAALGTMVVGTTLHEYDQYTEEKGIQPSEITRWGVALGAGAAEFAAEKLRLNSLMPNGMVGKMASKVLRANPDVADDMMRKWAKGDPKMFAKFKGMARTTGMNMLEEGTEEFATEVVQSYLNYLYQNPEDRLSIEEIGLNAAHAFKGGAMMGGLLGPASYTSNRMYHKMRRNRNGATIVETDAGEVFEYLGPDAKNKNNVAVLDGKLNTKSIRANLIKHHRTLSGEELGQYLDTYRNAQENLPAMEENFRKNTARQHMDQVGQGIVYRGEHQGDDQLVKMGQAEDGRYLFIRSEKEDATGKTTMTVIDPETMKPSFISSSQISNTYTQTYDSWIDAQVDQMIGAQDDQKQTQMAGDLVEEQEKVDSGIPDFSVSQSVGWKEREWMIREIGTDGSLAVDEIVDGEPIGEAMVIPADDLASVIPSEPVQPIVPEEGVEQGQPEAKVINDGKNDYNIVGGKIDQIYSTSKQANSIAKKLSEEYPKLAFNVHEDDKGDPFQKNDFTITVDVAQTAAQEETAPEVQENITVEEGAEIAPEITQEAPIVETPIQEAELTDQEAAPVVEGDLSPGDHQAIATQSQRKERSTKVDQFKEEESNQLQPVTDEVDQSQEDALSEIEDFQPEPVEPATQEQTIQGVLERKQDASLKRVEALDRLEREGGSTDIAEAYQNLKEKAQSPEDHAFLDYLQKDRDIGIWVDKVGVKHDIGELRDEIAGMINQRERKILGEEETKTEPVEQKSQDETLNKTMSSESSTNSLASAAKLLTDISKRMASVSKTFSSLDVETQRMMQQGMLSAAHQPEILNAIIGLVPIVVMDNLIGSKGSAEKLLHDPSMLIESLSFNGTVPVPVDRFFNSLADAITSGRASDVLTSTGYFKLGATEGEFLPADRANETNPVRNTSSVAGGGAEILSGASVAGGSKELLPTSEASDSNLGTKPDGTATPGTTVSPGLDLGRDQTKGLSADDTVDDRHNTKVQPNEQSNTNVDDKDINNLKRGKDKDDLNDRVQSAEAEVDTNPTEGQKKAGNYKKGRVSIQGLNIVIENPKGSTRSGTDQNGKKWSQKLFNSYGYFSRSKGKDGDQIDVFLGESLESEKAYVIDQVDTETKAFDEHKTMVGFDNAEDAKRAYLSNYEEGWQGLGAMTEMDMDAFKKWVGEGTRRMKPVSENKSIEKAPATAKKGFRDVLKAVPGLLELKSGRNYKSGKMGDPIMPFTIERQPLSSYHRTYEDKDAFMLIMEHNYLQNGDLMSDPRIDIAVYPNLKAIVPLNYEQHGIAGGYNEYVVDSKVVDQKGVNQTYRFLTTWMNNLVEQGRRIEAEEKIKEPIADMDKVQNRLVDLIGQYNKIPDSHKVKKSKAFQPISNMASQLGYGLEHGPNGKLKAINKNGKEVRSVRESIDYMTLDNIEDQHFVSFARDVLALKDHLIDIDIQIYGKALQKAVSDAVSGRMNANSDFLLREIKKMYDRGYVEYRKTESHGPLSISVDEFNDLTLDSKLTTFVNRNGTLDISNIDEALESNLITQREHDQLEKDFENEEQARQQAEREYWNSIYPSEFQGEDSEFGNEDTESQAGDQEQGNGRLNPNQDVEPQSKDIERNSPDGTTQVPNESGAIQPESESDTGSGEQDSESVRPDNSPAGTGERSGNVGDGIVGDLTTLFGEQGDNSVRADDRRSGDEGDVATTGHTDSGDTSTTEGQAISDSGGSEGDFTDAIQDAEGIAEKQLEQEGVAQKSVTPASLQSVQNTLPYLYAEQQEDVVKAERRFMSGSGILFTNATGTGKTFTGLGIVKRFDLQGKNTITIVVPTDVKAKDWIRDAKHLGLTVTQLKDTQQQGEGIIVTTYANYYQNEAIKNREHDLILYDESHYLMANQKGDQTATSLAHFKNANKDIRYALQRLQDNTGLWKRAAEINAKLGQLADDNEDSGLGDNQIDFDSVLDVESLEKELEEIKAEQEKILPELQKKAQAASNRTKVVFLSATPFKSHKTLRYGDGFLFEMSDDINDADPYKGYNEGGAEESFFISNFGYRMRYNKLTSPDADVDVPLLEREFVSKMVKKGIMSGRMLTTEFDYSREFPIISNKDSDVINEGMKTLLSAHKKEDPLYHLNKYANFRYRNFLYSNQLFENMKASLVKERVKQHMSMGRKVVIFHRYKTSDNVDHPFDFNDAYYEYYDRWNKEMVRTYLRNDKDAVAAWAYFQVHYPHLLNLDFDLRNPIEQLTEEFPQIQLINGDVPKRKRRQTIEDFKKETGGADIILLQEQAGREGIDLHDTKGTRQRVLINLGMPIDPITALQVEGRINRLGLKSNAVIEYPVLGLDLESYHFGSKINERVGTTENLAMGHKARDLRRSFKDGFLNSSIFDPNPEQGTGGQEFDKADSLDEVDEFQRARAFYYTNKKKTSRDKAREGQDYFATPEPVGFKMMEWANLNDGDKVLEPSAGHGAIARFAPEKAHLTTVEPSSDLLSKLKVNVDGDIKEGTFEDYYVGNKFDAVVMNPPFGSSGKTAMEHVEKAFKHVYNKGRVVAMVPNGPAMQKRLDKFLYGKDEKGRDLNPDAFLRAEINLPSVTFERAGTKVSTKIIVIDKLDQYDAEQITDYTERIDLTSHENINDLFDAIENLEVPGKVESVKASPAEQPVTPKQDTEFVSSDEIKKDKASILVQKHTKTGEDQHYVILNERVDRDQFTSLKSKAKVLNGYYSSWKGGGTKPGFIFKSEAQARAFKDHVNSDPDVRFKAADSGVAYLENQLKEAKEKLASTSKAREAKKKELSKRLHTQTDMFAGELLAQPVVQEQDLFAVKKDGSQKNIDNILSEFDRTITGLKESITKLEAQVATARKESEGQGVLFKAMEKESLFFSNTEKALGKISQKKATGEQWKAMLRKNGAKEAEMAWMDLDGFLGDRKAVTKEELSEYMDRNKIVVEEVEKSGKGKPFSEADIFEVSEMIDGGYSVSFHHSPYDPVDYPDAATKNEAMNIALEEANMQEELDDVRPGDAPKYASYTLPGGENYKEILLTMAGGEQTTYALVDPKDGEVIDTSTDYLALIDKRNIDGRGLVVVESEESKKNIKKDFSTSHWEGESNILAHVRFNERTDAEGNNVLFIEEIQSDWAQAGKRKGFKGDPKSEALLEIEAKKSELKDTHYELGTVLNEMYSEGLPTGASSSEMRRFESGLWEQGRVARLKKAQMDVRTNREYDAIQNELNEISDKHQNLGIKRRALIEKRDGLKEHIQDLQGGHDLNQSQAIPNMPFKKTNEWAGLAMRRMIRYAIDQGFDKVAWTTGEQQAERYDLSKHVKEINYEQDTDNSDNYDLQAIGHTGQEVISEEDIPLSRIEELVGKDIADKISKGEGEYSGEIGYRTWTSLSGLDLKVGGEGMKAFYDKILPNLANKIGKKYGAKVERSVLSDKNSTFDLQYNEIDQTWEVTQDGIVIDYYKNKGNAEQSLQTAEREAVDNLANTHTLPITKDLYEAYKDQVPMYKKEEPQFAGEALLGESMDAQVRSIAAKLSKDLNTPIEVVQNRSELPSPIQRSIKENKRIPGAYDVRNDKVYLISNEVKDQDEAARTVIHEVVGHKGMRELLGEEFDSVLNDVYNSMSQGDISKIGKRYNTGDRFEIADEYIAELAEGNTKQTVLDRVVAKVRRLFRKLFKIDYSKKDIIDMLNRSRKNLKKKETGPEFAGEMLDPRFKVADEVEETGPDPDGPPVDAIKTDKDKFRRTTQDRAISLRRLQEEVIERGGKMNDFANAYRQENLSHGIVKAAIESYNKVQIEPLVALISQIQVSTGMSYDEINMYMMAKHAPERNKQLQKKSGKAVNSGMTTKDADELVAKYEANMTKEQIRDFWHKINKATRFTLLRAKRDGFIPASLYDTLTGPDGYKHYVPLRGWAQSEEDSLFEYMQADVGKSVNPFRAAKGRKSLADDPLQYIVNMAHTAVVMGEKNRIKQHMAALIRNNKGMKDLFKFKKVYYVWDNTVDKEGKKNYTEVIEKPAQELWDEGLVETKFNSQHMTRRPRSNAQAHESDVWIGGEKYTMVLPADVANMLNKTPSKWDENSFALQNSIGVLTRWLSANFTSKNPAFIPINQIRDLQYALFSHMIKGEKGDAKKFMKAIPGARSAIIRQLKDKPDYSNKYDRWNRDFKLNGGETGYIHLQDVDQLAKNLKKDINLLNNLNEKDFTSLKGYQKHVGAQTIKVWRSAGEVLEHWAIRSENLSRLATYIVAKENGKSDKQAAQEAKDVTVNFNRKGRMSAVLGTVYAFFNAGIQGGHNIAKMANDHKRKFAGVGAGFMAMGFITALMNALWAGDDDDDTVNDYEELSDYQKYNNLTIPVPGRAKFVTIPLPHGFRFFNAAGVIAYQTLVSKEKDVGEAVKRLLSNAASAISPVNPIDFIKEDGGLSARPVVPTALMPALDLAMNENFAGNTIKREPFTSALNGRMANSQLGKTHVNKSIKWTTDLLFKLGGGDPETASKFYLDKDGQIHRVSDWLDINPSSVEHVIEYYLGGRFKAWNNAVKTSHSIVEGAYEVATGDKELGKILSDVNPNTVPVFRRMYSQPWQNSIYSRYYDIVNEIDDYKYHIRSQAGLSDDVDVRDLMDSYHENVEYELKYLRKDLKYIDQDIDDTDDPKQIEKLKDQKQELVRDFIETATKIREDENR